ncbi:membrane-bound inhibitor of C-type lysozyme [Rhodoligotrophos appendicifer]|uniref:MliC family protein n=1 Tax=Rhodoligotrophos appendicifer TaxID=987056 RepID=UPI00117FEFD3
MRAWAPALFAVFATGASGVTAADSLPPAKFQCSDISIIVHYRDLGSDGIAKTAVIDLPEGRSLRLPIAISGSGARYSDGTSSFWEHQGSATFEILGESWADCPLVK